MTRELLAYRIIIFLLYPFVVFRILARAIRDGGTRYLQQRLGIGFPISQQPIWVHCASVGEVNAARPLLELLLKTYHSVPTVVTTNTPTGGEMLQRSFGRRVTHLYLPLDFTYAIRRFVSHIKPRCLIILETELWPNLWNYLSRHSIPVVIVNGRLSKRTTQVPAILRRLYGQTLRQVQAILARSDTDKESFVSLGANPSQVTTIGNIKFSQVTELTTRLPSDPVGRPYWLAASTHDDEELRIARLWRLLDDSKHVLVIAPRHPERRASILKQLRSIELDIAIRSRGDPITEHTQLYLADTLGEMPMFMTYAKWVFLGGSLIDRGGQNILEPARLGKAIIVGPFMSNFADETRLLLDHNALIMVQNDEELRENLHLLLEESPTRVRLGENAKWLVNQHADIAEHYLTRLQGLGIFTATGVTR